MKWCSEHYNYFDYNIIYDWLSKNLRNLSFTPIGVRHTVRKPWIRAFQRYIIHWGSMIFSSSNLRWRSGSRVTRANSLKNSFLRKRVLNFFLSAGPRGPKNTSTTSTSSTILIHLFHPETNNNNNRTTIILLLLPFLSALTTIILLLLPFLSALMHSHICLSLYSLWQTIL